MGSSRGFQFYDRTFRDWADWVTYKTRQYQGQMIFRRSFVKWVPPQTIGKWNKGFYRVTTFVTPSGLFIIIIGLYLSVYWGTYEYCVSEKFSAWKPEFDCKYQFEACNIIVRQQRGLRCVLPSTIPGRALISATTHLNLPVLHLSHNIVM